MPDSSGHVPKGHHRNLFMIGDTVQRKMLWALADTGSTSTLISEEFYNNLKFKDPIEPPGNTVILAGNGTKMDLKGYTLLQFDVHGHTVYHEVGVVRDLGLDFILGASFLKAHGCILRYSPIGTQNHFEIGLKLCEFCKLYRRVLQQRDSPQLPPKEGCEITPSLSPLEVPRGAGDQCLLVGIGPDPEADKRAEKLDKVVKELDIYNLKIEDNIKHKLIQVIDECLDAFAADDEDLGKTDLVKHEIKTEPKSVPFKEKLRPVPLSLREWLKTEIDKLLKTKSIEPADPGEGPYASPVVIVRKKDGSHRLCVDFRRLNSQTIKDAYPLPRIDQMLPR